MQVDTIPLVLEEQSDLPMIELTNFHEGHNWVRRTNARKPQIDMKVPHEIVGYATSPDHIYGIPPGKTGNSSRRVLNPDLAAISYTPYEIPWDRSTHADRSKWNIEDLVQFHRDPIEPWMQDS